MITVVHVRRAAFKQGAPGCIYIGRNYAEFTDEGWSNPFHIGSDGDRFEVVAKHRAMVLRSPQLLARIKKELQGDIILGCWCKPEDCHGDVYAEIANGQIES